MLLSHTFDWRQIYIDIFFFFFNDTATTEIYTPSLHDALPISVARRPPDAGPHLAHRPVRALGHPGGGEPESRRADRKSTRLNSSHGYISYAVFCLKKKKNVTCLPYTSTSNSSQLCTRHTGHVR